jgi:hypothetical protein
LCGVGTSDKGCEPPSRIRRFALWFQRCCLPGSAFGASPDWRASRHCPLNQTPSAAENSGAANAVAALS